MEWLEILKGPLAASPVAAVLGFGCWTLWKKLETKEAQITAKDVEIARLNDERLSDLKQIAKLDD